MFRFAHNNSFERGVDVTETQRALNRAAQLLQEMGACEVAAGIVDVYPESEAPAQVNFTPAAVNRHLGTNVDAKTMESILTGLGFEVAANFDLKAKVYSFELPVDSLLKYGTKNFRYEPIPRYPAINRDLALIVDKTVTAADIAATIAKHGGKHFVGATLFDVYEGQQIESGKKSLAFALKFQSTDKTLVDAEADEAFNAIVAALNEGFKAELRG